MTVTIPLVQGTFYDISVQYKELKNYASMTLEWFSPSIQRAIVPPTNLYYSQRVKNVVYQVPVLKGPTIPEKATIENKPLILTAGKLS